MKRSKIGFVCALVIVLILAGCGPSEEEIMQMTADAATATPEPTPIPYEATISVIDTEGQPVSGATVAIRGDEHVTDDSGQVVLSDLSNGTLDLQVQLPGYFPLEQTASLDRGSNQVDLTIERDPEGLLTEYACGPGETLLYIEDFQDQKAEGWEEIELGLPGWAIAPNPDQPDDMVIAATEGAAYTTLSGFDDPGLDNAVWRFRFRYDGGGESHINWRQAPAEVDTRYIVNLASDYARLDRLVGNHVSVGEAGTPAGGDWHLMEISYFDGTVAVYIDGEEGFAWTDPNPWDGGTVAFEPYPQGDATFYYDDISVCGLSAPFTPLPPPQTGVQLTVNVVDQDGNPLPMATGYVPEMSSYAALATQVTGDAGMAVWNDLPAEGVTLQFSAPGYFSVEEAVSLEVGENSHSMTMTRDPDGMTLDGACLPDEMLLYSDDFEDGRAQGWEAIEIGIPMWSITENPDNPDDLVVAAIEGTTNLITYASPPEGYNNVVWRLRFRYDGSGWSHINFRASWENGDQRYIVGLEPNRARLDRLSDNGHVTIQNVGYPQKGAWHQLEISYFDGEVSVFLDGKKSATWTDANPWEGGTISLEPYPSGESVFYYDDLAVCEIIESPTQSILSLEEAE